ncbi:MAG: universal stress protein [Flavobacteriales bacterium]|jgi:nucleotide-binding universal stress UspA family protein|nr:universal stress protein [Flavobacteriales bacterium]MCB9364059.1 universal stress protein [Flavobacteriales bacterium]
MKTNKILVPIDFSDQSLIALSQSYNLAKKIDAEIILLYVIEEVTPMIKRFYKELEGIHDAVLSNLKNLAEEKSKESGLKIDVEITEGKIYSKIIEVAKKLDVTFIIMGTRGREGSKFIGSNANKVVKTAPCPVITIKGKMHNQGCERIVLPLDLTKETRDKVDQAIMFAKLFKAEIYIISILLTGKEDVVNKLKDQLVIVRQHIERENVQCTAEIIKILKSEESLSNAVIKYAEKINADLIMIMTQQENEIKQLFIGSKAKEIIKNSEIPVLSIKPLSLNRIEIS